MWNWISCLRMESTTIVILTKYLIGFLKTLLQISWFLKAGKSKSPNTCLQALEHASIVCRRKLVIQWVPASDLEDSAAKEVSDFLSTCQFFTLLLSSMVNVWTFCVLQTPGAHEAAWSLLMVSWSFWVLIIFMNCLSWKVDF